MTIVSPGLCTLLVDHGRPRTRSHGVPVGGTADRFALALGNALVGNPPDTPALEITLSGPTIVGDVDLGCVVFGAPFEVRHGKQHVAPCRTFTLSAGTELAIHGTPHAARAYLCVAGGLDGPLVLSSRSSLDAIKPGTQIACWPGRVTRSRFVSTTFAWNAEPLSLRYLPGAQASWFPSRQFEGQSYSVAPASNRMGLRLKANPLDVPDREIASEPVCPGTVQVTRDGQCIVLGVDGQTIGGYPKIAQVIAADIDKLGQLRPDDRLTFMAVKLEEAEAADRAKRAELKQWLLRIAAAG